MINLKLNDDNNLNKSEKKGHVLLLLHARFIDWKGTQRMLYEFGSHLVREGYKVTLLENTEFENVDGQIPLNSLPKIPFKIIGTKFKKKFGYLKPPENIIQDLKPDVIYVASFNVTPSVPLFGYKTVLGMHSLFVGTYRYRSTIHKLIFRVKLLFFKAFFVRSYIKRKTVFHALNKSQSDWITALTSERNLVKLIHNPISCNQVKTSFFSQGVETDRFTVLFFGSFSKPRGFDTFLKLVEMLTPQEAYKDISFLTAGDGPLKDNLLQLMKTCKTLTYLGKPDDEEKSNIYSKSHLFVYPTVSDNFPYIVAEALLHGLPVLATNLSGIDEEIENGVNGYLIEPKDYSTYIENIIRFFKEWSESKNTYSALKTKISIDARKFCTDRILPNLTSMIEETINS